MNRRIRPGRATRLAPLALLALAHCSPGPATTTDGGPLRDAGADGPVEETGFRVRPVSIETVAPMRATAGQPLMVSCLLQDADGERFSAEGAMTSVLYVPSTSVAESMGAVVPTRAGMLDVACSERSFALVDATPARVEIVAGPAVRTVARVERSSVTAGESLAVRCEAFDSYGNAVAMPATSLAIAPTQSGNTVTDAQAMFTRSGLYDVSCTLAGATADPTRIEVLPGEPAQLQISRVPEQGVYARDQVIEVRARVTDTYGNEVPAAAVSFASTPTGQALGNGRFRFTSDGSYVVTANAGPDGSRCGRDDTELCKHTTIVVDSEGPGIICGPNANGSNQWDATALSGNGTAITLAGRVSDTTGVRSVQVNGRPVTLSSGAFSISLTPRQGANFIDIAAIDTSGRENSRTCVLLYGQRWLGESALMSDAVALQLKMSAIDDGDPTSPITSLDDMVQTVLNSQGLRDTLHRELLAANPLKPSSCDTSVFGACVFRSEINYVDSQLQGVRTSSLALVDGGLRVTLAIPLLRVRVRVSGTLDTTGWINFENVTAAATLDLSLSASRRPQVRVRAGSVTSSVGRVNPDFPGVSGVIIDVIASVAQNRLRQLVNTTLQGYVSRDLNSTLDSVVGGLSISTLGSTFNVPRLEGTGSVRLDFGVDFSSVSANTTRALIGIGTRFSAPTVTRMTPTPGVWQLAGSTYLLDPSNTQPAAATVHTGVLNQALHALWRGGWLDARIAGGSLGAGVVAVVRTPLPPITQPRAGSTLALELPAMDLELTVPNVFDPPLRVRAGAVASTRVTLAGNAFSFSPVSIDELHFALTCDTSGCPSISPENRDQLEMLLRRTLQRIADTSLSSALPAVPIPSFPIPASLAMFGLPAGSQLGLNAPALTLEGQHYVLRSRFGVR